MPTTIPPSGDPNPGAEIAGSDDETDQARAATALRAAFTRLQPQGSDAWNFLAAFTHLGDRYGPYHPGASGLSDLLGAPAPGGARKGGRLDRLRAGRDRVPEGEQGELEAAMAQVVEAFRFLSARVTTLEARLAAEDRPVDGAAWLTPARELGDWVAPVAAHVLAHTPGGEIVHADCGEGGLLRALADGGALAHGVEPRGGVALRALEGGCRVTIGEAHEYLADRAAGSLGGVVLSGVVDRLPLHALLPLLTQCRRTLALGAPLVVLSEPVDGAARWDTVATELVAGRPLHRATWELLLDRAGFGGVATPAGADGAAGDGRVAVAASTPS